MKVLPVIMPSRVGTSDLGEGKCKLSSHFKNDAFGHES
jgi:hypothetical protein